MGGVLDFEEVPDVLWEGQHVEGVEGVGDVGQVDCEGVRFV